MSQGYRPGRRFPDAEVPGKAGYRLHDLMNASVFHLLIFSDVVDGSALAALEAAHGDVL